MRKLQRVFASVDLEALISNVKEIERLSHGKGIIAVIKANGYGHGAVPIAEVLEPMRAVHGFAVATCEEALKLREAGINKPIIILGYEFPENYPDIIKSDIGVAVFKEDQAKLLSEEAVRQGKTALFHVAVDTGMSRIGVSPDEIGVDTVRYFKKIKNVRLSGAFTHFARADEGAGGREATERQIEKFSHFLELSRQAGITYEKIHISNSAGIIDYPDTQSDLVRAGIILYGLLPSENYSKLTGFSPVLELKSHIVYIKYVERGTPVSYGGTYVAQEKRRVATIPVGYGDGYPRTLSNKGWVLIRGKKAPILGRVCMDQFMVDVTDIPKAMEYDEVTLIGRDGSESISMETLGDLSGRFNYELACCLTDRVPRVYKFPREGPVIG